MSTSVNVAAGSRVIVAPSATAWSAPAVATGVSLRSVTTTLAVFTRDEKAVVPPFGVVAAVPPSVPEVRSQPR